ncbi:IS701 family transposase [Kitasatospora cathayae]|uniref:Transposase n=1 Tax=Kitasatospora cathayae TaxID=3004092 RepID=A0ABY7PY80_9ACTN|nr:transposase [Kitasatospora sp. HUAS 3-15]WBP85132.1 transposase [Kitasatospora sp. HUAS 3-15]
MDAGFDGFDPQGLSQDRVDRLCGQLLASVPRSDQRRWGELYVRGLLSAKGRKTMKGIAEAADSSAMQSLQQFITTSPWEWKPVRQSLARFVDRELQPVAWIVEPLAVPKAGRHSVGVSRQFVPGLGRMANCQQSTGVWLASEEASCPVDWQLALPASWVSGDEARRRAAVPDHVRSQTPVQCAVGSVVSMAEDWRLTPRPVVMTATGGDLAEVLGAFVPRRIPFVLGIDACLRVAPADPRLPVGDGRQLPAEQLLASVAELGAGVEWRDSWYARRRVARVVGVRVALPAAVDRSTGMPPLFLIGAWIDPHQARPTELFLSNIGHLSSSALFRIAKLTRRVSRDLKDVCGEVGIRDFAGRSFRGWHHHATLVSIAHAISVLAGLPRQSGRLLPQRRLPLIGSR